MKLTESFDVYSDSDIRVRGTRVGIETVLLDFLEGFSPEEIAVRYRTLTLEQVYATITYYLHQRETVDAYLQAYREEGDRAYEQQARRPSEAVKRLRQLKQPVT